MIQAPLSMSDLTPVLLVEDDMGDAALTRAILCGDDSSQFELTHVRSRQEALGQFSLNEYHVVLLDLNLPDSRGLKTVQEFLQADSNTPIIVLSGQDDEAMAIESVQVGAQDYILKGDTSGRHLRRSIRYAIERKRAELELSRLALYDELTLLSPVLWPPRPARAQQRPGARVERTSHCMRSGRNSQTSSDASKQPISERSGMARVSRDCSRTTSITCVASNRRISSAVIERSMKS